MTAVLLLVVSFVAMELVSYAAHRWVMHGVGMRWHRSHHLPPAGRLERNDLFPLCFSLVGVAAFALPATGIGPPGLFWVATGITLYGACYLLVHDVYVHRRLPVPVPRSRLLDRLRESHAIHHRLGGEPYGMLFPVVTRELRARANGARAHAPDAAASAVDRDTTRSMRSRL